MTVAVGANHYSPYFSPSPSRRGGGLADQMVGQPGVRSYFQRRGRGRDPKHTNMNKHQGKRPQSTTKQWVFLLFLLLAFFIGSGGGARPLSPVNIDNPSTVITDRHGRLLYEVVDPNGQKLQPVPLAQIPLACRQATIAAEDHRFYHHVGIDPLSLLRATWQYSRYGHVISGASTITQQTVRLLYMKREEGRQRTLQRKLKEMWLAWRLERSASKQKILSLYLNHTYYGNFAVGIGAAAEAYFGSDISDLDTAQCALLAGLPQNPAAYNPLTNFAAAKVRQKTVLSLIAKNGYLSPQEAGKAAREPLSFAASPAFPIRAPHFVMLVQQILERELGIERVRAGGLKVTTTIDLGWQEQAEAVVRRQLQQMQAKPEKPVSLHANNAALVALNPQDGQILAWVGSPNYFDQQHAGAVNAVLSLRQPGSALKPFTYAAAFDPALPDPYTQATVLLDLPTVFYDNEGNPYQPLNYDRRWHGPTSLRTALACSYNSLAVKVLQHTGIGNFLRLANNLGLNHLPESEANLSLTLGGGEETLLNITAAYGALANGGHYVVPIAIRRVTDSEGKLLLSNVPVRREDKKRQAGEPIIDSRVAFLITDILSDDTARAPAFGRFSPLYLPRPAAAKTGTTTNWRDNWTFGYTPDLVTGVWVGNADNEPMYGISGISGAAPIWHQFMQIVTRREPARPFPRPEGLLQKHICSDSGLLATPLCPHQRLAWFIAGTEPTSPDDQYQEIAVDTRSGLRADTTTPPQYVRREIFRVLPPEAAAWAEENNIPQPPPPTVLHVTAEQPLLLTAPDPESVFVFSPGLSPAEQQIALRASSSITLRQLTFVLDGHSLPALSAPPWETWWTLQPGEHRLYVQGNGQDGTTYRSDEIHFLVKG